MGEIVLDAPQRDLVAHLPSPLSRDTETARLDEYIMPTAVAWPQFCFFDLSSFLAARIELIDKNILRIVHQ